MGGSHSGVDKDSSFCDIMCCKMLESKDKSSTIFLNVGNIYQSEWRNSPADLNFHNV
jgi:hypothetical protein